MFNSYIFKIPNTLVQFPLKGKQYRALFFSFSRDLRYLFIFDNRNRETQILDLNIENVFTYLFLEILIR